MNIYDISKKAGVSIATVSRVINGNAYVSERMPSSLSVQILLKPRRRRTVTSDRQP